MQEGLGGVWGRIVSCCMSSCCRREKGQNNQSTQLGSTSAVVVIPERNVPTRVSPSNSSPVPVQPVKNVYTALYDYHPRTDEDLSFREGDQLQILNQDNADWWYARALTGASANRSGYIPANYVAPLESLHAQPWYFPDTKRADAEKLLLSEANQHGTFLIRQCESQPGELSMSVFDGSDGKVKHYKIRQLDGGEYYVTKNQTFSTLNELVEYYRHTGNGLCAQLGQPCRKVIAPQTKGLSYNTMDQWEISRSSIQLIRLLGNGQFGQVYEGLWNNTTPVAVKTPKQGKMDREDFLREAQIMKKLLHPKLIQLYAVCTIGEPIYIITELMHSSLLDYLRKDKGKTLGVADQVEMAGQVAAGMAYLEQQNYIHRDLAARNVLVGENNMCKVADFGLARVFLKETDDEDGDEDEGVYKVTHGTKFPVRWTAPEALHDNIYTIKSDVWSFGILIYEIITYGEHPYPSLSNAQVIQMVHKGHRLACPSRCPKRLYELMMDCWKSTAPDRPTFETLQWRLEEFYEMDVSAYDDANRY